MRKYKFKAIRVDKNGVKEVEYIEDMYWFEENQVHNNGKDGSHLGWDIRESTGLLDKNGVEVYEGDNVKVNWMLNIGKIVWRKGGFYVMGKGFSYSMFSVRNGACEVI